MKQVTHPTDVPWHVQEDIREEAPLRFRVVTDAPDGERYGWLVCTLADFPDPAGRQLAYLIRAAPRMQRALAELLGAAEADGMDLESNVWRSAMINAREALELTEPQEEATP